MSAENTLLGVLYHEPQGGCNGNRLPKESENPAISAVFSFTIGIMGVRAETSACARKDKPNLGARGKTMV
jgi:hypothetical protein